MKVKKQWERKSVEPRTTQAIDDEYKLATASLGGVSYQIEALTQRSKQLLNRINELVQENQRRNELDEKAKDVKPQG